MPAAIISTLRTYHQSGVHSSFGYARRLVSTTLEPADALGREIVAVVGLLEEWAHLDIVAAVVGELTHLVADHVADLEAHGVLHGTSPVRLVHTLGFREALADLAGSRRALLNSRIAEELSVRGAPDSLVCGYLVQAPGAANADHVALLRREARAVSRIGRHGDAVGMLRRALREPPTPETIAEILVELADELSADGAHAEGLAIAQQARDTVERADLRVNAVKSMVRALYGADRVEEGIRLVGLEIERLPPGHEALALQLEHELVRYAGHDARMLEASLERFSPERVDDSLPEAAAYLLAMSQILAMGCRSSAGEAIHLVERSVALGILDGDGTDETIRSAWLLVRADEWHAARRILSRRRAATPPDLNPPELSAFEGLVALRAGRVEEAVVILTDALAHARQLENSFAETASLAFLAHALYEADETTRLADLLAEPELDYSMRSAWTAILRVARARVLLDQGRPEDALSDLLIVDRQKIHLGLTNPAGFDQAEHAVVALVRLGRPTEAQTIAERNLGQATLWGAPETLARAHRAIAGCSPPSRAPDHLTTAMRCLGDDRVRLIGAQIGLDLGASLIAVNRRRDAEPALRDALDIATRIGARRIAREATSALAAIGRRVRRPHARGVEALTPAELRVAALAASRQSNKAIAATLHLSVRTVENTLRHAYQKLETDRAGLAAQLLTREPPADALRPR
jgi:DNA-binding CsgD family transcriptional regulator